MKKDEFNALFREHARNSLSPAQKERNFVSEVYNHICKALNNNCIQIGSYPRFTSIHPLHDLDVLYIIGNQIFFSENPSIILNNLLIKIQNYFHQHTNYILKFCLQTHSVTISFIDSNNKEYFSIDIVPAYINAKNEFNLDTYIVPEIVKMRRSKRVAYYKAKEENRSSIKWIKSDPRGYIQIATNINENNDDFRKAVKLVKKWKYNASNDNVSFKLKSFHIEQIFVQIFQKNLSFDIFDAIFNFYFYLPKYIIEPQFSDRADSTIFIDDYLNDLTDDQKELIRQARDRFLITLESLTSSSSINDLLNGVFYKRYSLTEQYLFDEMIPTFIDPNCQFTIEGYLKYKQGFRDYKYPISYNLPVIEINNHIKFQIEKNSTKSDLYKWKVKNSNESPQPRGEITDHQTKNNPESTKYRGNHYVECFAIKNNSCIAKNKVAVRIG